MSSALAPATRTQPGTAASLELADLFEQYQAELGALSAEQRRVVQDIRACRTAALGGHVQQCDQCGHLEISYNSCRNRHCPKCQALEQNEWLEARQAELLPVPYFHTVFTVPDVLHPFFLANPRVALAALFASVNETLQEVALNPRLLGARIGFTAVLHTWTQTLLYHPHLHCIIPGGGLSPDGTRWVQCKKGFLLPVRVLSKVFRGKLLGRLEAAVSEGRLQLSEAEASTLLRKAAGKSWVVYSKRPFAGPEQVLSYLGRYTHRIAISNRRLVSARDGQVTFRYRDRADGNQTKTMTLEAGQFLRRFLLHVLPKGLVRIRHFGFLANAVKAGSLARCRELLDAPQAPALAFESWQERMKRLTGKDVELCPHCEQGHLVFKALLLKASFPWRFPGRGTIS